MCPLIGRDGSVGSKLFLEVAQGHNFSNLGLLAVSYPSASFTFSESFALVESGLSELLFCSGLPRWLAVGDVQAGAPGLAFPALGRCGNGACLVHADPGNPGFRNDYSSKCDEAMICLPCHRAMG